MAKQTLAIESTISNTSQLHQRRGAHSGITGGGDMSFLFNVDLSNSILGLLVFCKQLN